MKIKVAYLDAGSSFELAKRALPLIPGIRAIDKTQRTITFVASTEAEDRYGDVIEVAGWETANYEKNPVFLFAHRSDMPPVGKCIKVTKEGGSKPALVQVVQFATKDVFPFAETIWKLYAGAFLRAVSVGFMPLEYPKVRVDPETEERLGYRFMHQELLELSGVPVPANPEALGKAISKHLLSEREAEQLIAKPGELLRRSYKLRGFFGDDNPPWTYEVPGVTYALDEVAVSKGAKMAPGEGTCTSTDCACKDFQGDGEVCSAPGCGHAKAMHVGAKAVRAEPGPENDPDDGEIETVPGKCSVEGCDCKQFVPGAEENLCNTCGHLKSKHAGGEAPAATELNSCAVCGGPSVLLGADGPRCNAHVNTNRTVCPFKEETKAPDDYPWDAGKEMAKQTTPAGWKRMSTVIVGDAANKTSYKLPHHKGDGFAVVKRGVNNALARVGQTQMDAADRPGARSHLAKHKAQFEPKGFDAEVFCATLEALEKNHEKLAEAKDAGAEAAFRAICGYCGADHDEVLAEITAEENIAKSLETKLAETAAAIIAEFKSSMTEIAKQFLVLGELSAGVKSLVEARAALEEIEKACPANMQEAVSHLGAATKKLKGVIAHLDTHTDDASKEHATKLRGAETIMEKSHAQLSASLPNEEPAEGEPDGDGAPPAGGADEDEPVLPSHGENEFDAIKRGLAPSVTPSFDELLKSLTVEK